MGFLGIAVFLVAVFWLLLGLAFGFGVALLWIGKGVMFVVIWSYVSGSVVWDRIELRQKARRMGK